MDFHYVSFGLRIVSSIPLPAPEMAFGPESDVTIDVGAVPEHLADVRFKGVRFQAADGELLLKVDGIAVYHIRKGSRITIAPEKGAKADDILVFLMGSAMGALLHQRAMLVLHAGAVQVDGGSALFSGVSGVGKSTLTACFHKKGYPFLADDLSAVSTGNGRPSVMAGFPQLKLWSDTLKKLEIDPRCLTSVRWGNCLEKYVMPVAFQQTRAVPVKDIFVIQPANRDTIDIIPLKGSDKINSLVDNTFRMNFLKGLGGKSSHFHHCVVLGNTARVFKVLRPNGGFLLSELADAVEEKILS